MIFFVNINGNASKSTISNFYFMVFLTFLLVLGDKKIIIDLKRYIEIIIFKEKKPL